jgi:hypothetical protein
VKTDRAKELLKHFKLHGISRDPKGGEGLKLILEWQDIIGQASIDEIRAFEDRLPPMAHDGVDRDTFLFVNMHCLSYEQAIQIFKVTYGERVFQAIEANCEDRHEKGLKEVYAKQKQLNELLMAFTDRESDWKLEVEKAKREVKNRDQTIDEQAETIQHLETALANARKASSNWFKLNAIVKELINAKDQPKPGD